MFKNIEKYSVSKDFNGKYSFTARVLNPLAKAQDKKLGAVALGSKKQEESFENKVEAAENKVPAENLDLKAKKKKLKVEAAMGGYGNGGAGSYNGITGTAVTSATPYLGVLDGIIPEDDWVTKRKIYKDIYTYDIAGAVVDLISTLPFSDFNLVGINDPAIIEGYIKAIEDLHLPEVMPAITTDYLVNGAFIGSLNWNEAESKFTSLLPHHLDDCEISSLGVIGMDPIIDLTLNEKYSEVLSNTKDSRVERLLSILPDYLKQGLNSGKIELNPATTLYIPRRGMTDPKSGGSSYFNRIITIHLLEKALIKGTIESAQRRQRAIMHIQAGIEEVWEPTQQELSELAGYFLAADLDPISGIVVTRNGVNISDVKCLAGDSLITTNKGILKIKDFVKHNPDSLKKGTGFDTSIKVLGKSGNFEEVEKWWYQGIQPVFNIELENNTNIRATENHKFVVFDKEFSFKKVKDIKEGDIFIKIFLNENSAQEYTKIEYVKVKNIQFSGNEPTYDLTMKGDPIFTVENFLCHNSGNDFWKWDDVFNFGVDVKMRAMGVNDAILSGDASFNTLESSISAFMDNVSNTRDIITNATFKNRIFPIVAYKNNYRTVKKESQTVLAKNQDVEISNYRIQKSGNQMLGHVVTGGTSLFEIGDISQYAIPSIQWSKQLKPKADKEYLDLLERLKELGVPIALRAFAAAGGENIDDLISSMEDDNDMRLEIADKYKDLLDEAVKEKTERFLGIENIEELLPQQENDYNSSFAKLHAYAKENSGIIDTKHKFRNLANADEIYGVREYNSNGKRRILTADAKIRLENKIHKQMAEALPSGISKSVNKN